MKTNASAIPWQMRRGTSNRKLGTGAWVVTIGQQSCPATCPLKGHGCYAENGPLAITWQRVTSGQAHTHVTGRGPASLADALRIVPRGAMIRIGDAGDSSFGQRRIPAVLTRAVEAAKQRGVDVIAYSHLTGPLPRWVNRSSEATTSDERTHPTVRVYATADDIPNERHIVRCPAEYSDAVSCDRCRLCAKSDRRSIVAFTAHGSGANQVRQAIAAANKNP